MIGLVTTAGRRRDRLPGVIVGAIAAAWAVAIAAEMAGAARLLHHDALIEGDLPAWAAITLFTLAWQLMIVAMMLPSSLPLIAAFRLAASGQPSPSTAVGGLLVGYAGVWTAFGLLAFGLDVVVHRSVHAMPWLGERPHLVAGSVLVLAGAFQFSGLKARCLSECRHPGAFLVQRYRRGVAAAVRLGIAHGTFCLGCCWALMLVGFAVGVANAWWMAALTAVMVLEKTARWGDRLVGPVGTVLLALGAAALLGLWTPSFGG